jgi:PIN domain nuclease of toxin-antitoxin system
VTVLLDTCMMIDIAENSPVSTAARHAVDKARGMNAVLVSPVSAFELGVQAHDKQRFADWLQPSARLWFERFIKTPGLALAPFDYRIAMNATNPPGDFHRDPADRFLVSTARALDCALVTRDTKILDYAAQGHVKAIAC